MPPCWILLQPAYSNLPLVVSQRLRRSMNLRQRRGSPLVWMHSGEHLGLLARVQAWTSEGFRVGANGILSHMERT
jgi:hypothetical protein